MMKPEDYENYFKQLQTKLFKMNDNVDAKMTENKDNWALFGWKGDILELLGFIEDLPLEMNLEGESSS